MSLIYTNYLYNTDDFYPEVEFIFSEFSELSNLRLEAVFFIKEDLPHILTFNCFTKEDINQEFLLKFKFFRKHFDINQNDVLGILINLYI